MDNLKTKTCKRCEQEKPLTDYYKHSGMADGTLSFCKECKKAESKDRSQLNSQDEGWVEKERERHRDKYYRLGYKDKHKPTAESKAIQMKSYKDKYPEKYYAKRVAPIIEGLHAHHWSYNEDHRKDVIHLEPKDHYTAHRFIVYDQSSFMYKTKKEGVLLDTKEKHQEFIIGVIKNEKEKIK